MRLKTTGNENRFWRCGLAAASVLMLGVDPAIGQFDAEGDVVVLAESTLDYEDCDCPDEKKGTLLTYTVTRDDESDSKDDALDFHIRTSDNDASNFKCWDIEYRKSVDPEEWESQDEWDFAVKSQKEGKKRYNYMSWHNDEFIKRQKFSSGETWRFTVVYCGPVNELKDSLYFILTTDGTELPTVPDKEGNRADVPNIDSSDDPGWEMEVEKAEGSKVGFGAVGFFGGDGTGGGKIWGIDNGADLLGTFEITSPGVFAAIGNTGIVSGFVNSVEFDSSGDLWASDGVSLYSLDTGTGAGSLVGSHGTGETMTDFSWDGTYMYGISTVCGASSSLWTIDLTTGLASAECSELLPGACDVGLTIDHNGRMYGHDLISDSIYTIDGGCGTASHLVLPYDSNFGQALTSGLATNFHVAFNATAFAGELYEFDGTGSYNFLGVLQPLQIAGADTEPATPDCLLLSVSALISGSQATWDVSGATPGERVAVVYGHQDGTTVVNGTFGYCATFDIKGVNQGKVICQKNADGNGDVSCSKPIPAGAAGVRVLSQAAERNTCPDKCVSSVDDQVIL